MRNVLLILILFASLCIPALSTAQVVLKTDSLEVSCVSTDTIVVPLRVFNFTDVGSFQFTLSWNPQNLDYIATNPLDPLFTVGAVNFGFDTTTFINQGKLTFNWTKFGGGTVPDSTVLFGVAFVRIGGPYTPVAFVDVPVAVEVTDADGNEIPWMVMNGGVNPLDNKPPLILCPPDVLVSAPGPTPVANIAPDSLSDNCGAAAVGFQIVGATVFNAPNDPDASGTTFNFGLSTVTYTATDVGGNTNTCSFTVTVEPTATDDLTILAGNVSGSCNQVLSIPITTLNFDSLGSLQFSVGWNTAVLDYQSVGNFNPALQLSPSNFGVAQIGAGFLSFNWTTSLPLTGGTSLPDGAVLFTIDFTVIGVDGDNSAIQFGDFPAVREAILAENLQEIPFVTIDGQANIIDNTTPNLVCPANVAVPADAGQTYATLTNLGPLALNDNCSGTVQLGFMQTGATTGSGQGPANGIYNAGTTTVTYTATDVAGNTATCAFTVTVDAGETLNLFIDSLTVDCQGAGDTVSFDVTVENFTDVWGLQFSVAWDETVLGFVSVSNFYPGLGLDASSFLGFVSTPGGLLRFLDGDGTNGWPDIADGDVLFTINFVVLNANATTSLDFIPPFDAVDGTFSSIPLSTTAGFFQSADQSPPIIFCPPPQTAVAPLGQCNATVILPAPTVTDGCGAIADTTQTPPGNTFITGTHFVFYTATDDAGNSAVCSFTVTVSEITPPQLVNCPANDTVNATQPNCQGIATWTPPTANDNCGVATVLPPNFPPGSSFPLGNTTVTYLAADQSNNIASCNFTITVQDLEPPVITCPADLTATASAGAANCEGIVFFDAAVASDNCDQQLNLSSDWISGDTFPVGTTVVTFEAEDNFANTATCQFLVTVQDSVVPSIICPPSSVDTSDANACGTNVSWSTPSVSDNCDQNIVATPDTLLQSGDFFAIGATVITYTATDGSGNSSSCSFSITVLETVPPVLTNCPTLIYIELPSADCDTVVSWTPPSATDNCAFDTLIATPPPGSNFVAGITPVTYTAIDSSGNSTTCTFDVVVADKVPPVLGACPPNDTVQVSGSCGIVYPWQLPSVSDNCDPDPTITASPAPGDTLQIGTNTIIVYAEDASGNRDTCLFVVVVQGSSNPEWTIPDDIVETTDSCSLPVAWPPATFTGYCDTVIIDSTHVSGQLFPIGTTTVFYTFTDINGGSIVDSFTITINEIIPPSIVCPTGVIANAGGVVLADPGEIVTDYDTVATCDGIRLFFNTPIGIDNCTTGTTTVEPLGLTSGDAFPVGLNTLTYVATDASGNTAVCSFNIEVFGLEMFVEVMPIVACEPGQFDTLTAEAIGGATYFWTGPDGEQIADSDNQVIIVAGGGSSGLYTVYAELNGCLTPVDSALVIVAPDIVAQNDTFVLSPGSLDTLEVLNNDIFVPADGEVCDYFPDDNNDLVLLPNGTFTYGMGEQPFTFTYMLCSKTCPNLVSEATVTIQLQVEDCEFIPNVFTPNQDGDHDVFVIPCLEGGAQRLESSIVIYNQWGDKVFEAEPYLNDWDGTLNGQAGNDLPDGTYFYIFKPRPNDPPQKGFVEIFR